MDQSGFNWGMPVDNIGTYGAQVDALNSYLHWFMLVLFVFWGGFFAFCLFRFRARKGHVASYSPIHAVWSKWLEIGIVVIEAVLLVGLSMPVWAKFKKEFPARADATEVRIIAQQFAWNFHYPGTDGEFGKAHPRFVSGGNPAGLDPEDPQGKDDIVTINTLRFPVDKPVIARISSRDVIHSFGVPALRLKQDAIPGMEIPIWFEASVESIDAALESGGGTPRGLVTGNHVESGATLSLVVSTGSDVTISHSEGFWGKAEPGDVLWIRSGSDLAGPGGVNVGAYQVAAADAKTISATKKEGTPQDVAAAKITSHEGFDVRGRHFEIACSQLCGITHYNMKAILKPQTQAEFLAWSREQTGEVEDAPEPEAVTPQGTTLEESPSEVDPVKPEAPEDETKSETKEPADASPAGTEE